MWCRDDWSAGAVVFIDQEAIPVRVFHFKVLAARVFEDINISGRVGDNPRSACVLHFAQAAECCIAVADIQTERELVTWAPGPVGQIDVKVWRVSRSQQAVVRPEVFYNAEHRQLVNVEPDGILD